MGLLRRNGIKGIEVIGSFDTKYYSKYYLAGESKIEKSHQQGLLSKKDNFGKRFAYSLYDMNGSDMKKNNHLLPPGHQDIWYFLLEKISVSHQKWMIK
jgi:hypothetical protein